MGSFLLVSSRRDEKTNADQGGYDILQSRSGRRMPETRRRAKERLSRPDGRSNIIKCVSSSYISRARLLILGLRGSKKAATTKTDIVHLHTRHRTLHFIFGIDGIPTLLLLSDLERKTRASDARGDFNTQYRPFDHDSPTPVGLSFYSLTSHRENSLGPRRLRQSLSSSCPSTTSASSSP